MSRPVNKKTNFFHLNNQVNVGNEDIMVLPQHISPRKKVLRSSLSNLNVKGSIAPAPEKMAELKFSEFINNKINPIQH